MYIRPLLLYPYPKHCNVGVIVQKQGRIPVLRPYHKGFWVYHDRNIVRIHHKIILIDHIISIVIVTETVTITYFCTMIDVSFVIEVQKWYTPVYLQL